jgi:DMSO reductase family type II enzyme chaperone
MNKQGRTKQGKINMPELTVQSNLNADPITRSNIYKLLSAGFKYPTPEIFDALKDGTFMEELWELVTSLSHVEKLSEKKGEMNRKINHGLENLTYTDFEGKYIETFEVGKPKPPCPPYEGLFRESEVRSSVMIEISEFYKHFGLLMSREEGKKDLPDHLSAELEFLHFLTFKEAQAREEENEELLEGYLRAQRDFLQRHPAAWVPKFYQKLQDLGLVPFYVMLAQIASQMVQSDLEWLNSELEEA